MDGGEGEDGIEPAAFRLPYLEVGVDHLNRRKAQKLRSCDRRELLAKLDTRDRVATLREGQGRLPGSAADLDEAGRLREPGERDEIVEHLSWVCRAGAVVEHRDLVEGSSQVTWRHVVSQCNNRTSMEPATGS